MTFTNMVWDFLPSDSCFYDAWEFLKLILTIYYFDCVMLLLLLGMSNQRNSKGIGQKYVCKLGIGQLERRSCHLQIFFQENWERKKEGKHLEIDNKHKMMMVETQVFKACVSDMI